MNHPLHKHSLSIKKILLLSGLIVLLPLSACMTVPTQQGNVLKLENLARVHAQDSRYQVEMLIGTPVLRDDLHPNRAIYVDEYNNPDTGETRQRRVEILYNESGRVKSIERFGFELDQPADD